MSTNQTLGKRLRVMREKLRETLAEVSGAVEIEIDTLANIEHDVEKPSEDILLLLISHFNVKEEDAKKLWELAEYEPLDSKKDSDLVKSAGITVLPADARIIYTDIAHAVANQNGLVINFMQESGLGGQPLIVSRLGMSKEHARSLIEALKKTLDQSEPKALPAPKEVKRTDENAAR